MAPKEKEVSIRITMDRTVEEQNVTTEILKRKIMKMKEKTRAKVKDVAKEAEKIGVGSLLFTNIDIEGLMRGIKTEVIEEVISATNLPVVVSGGVSSGEDVRRIKETEASGVVIGSALYKGKIDFKDVLPFQDC